MFPPLSAKWGAKQIFRRQHGFVQRFRQQSITRELILTVNQDHYRNQVQQETLLVSKLAPPNQYRYGGPLENIERRLSPNKGCLPLNLVRAGPFSRYDSSDSPPFPLRSL